jgi:rhodanese-related sulfurtransferase
LCSAIVILGIIPLVFYWFYVGRVPSITPQEAVELLEQPSSTAILVDIRNPEEFEGNRLNDAQNWPYKSIMALSARDAIPKHFAGKHLILLCKSGIKSAQAVRKLQKLQVANVTNVRGGMETWVGNVEILFNLEFYKISKNSGVTMKALLREAPRFEQWIAVIFGFVIKYAGYMLLALVLIVVLWRVQALDLKALKWGLIFFLLGEASCGANYFIYQESSYLFEYLHSFGMVLSFGFVTFAILEGLDKRIIKVSDAGQRCAALGLCRSCIKYTHAPCGLKRLFIFVIPVCIAISFIPLTVSPYWVSYNTHIFGTLYNYSHSIVYQLFEFRFCPIIAIILFIPALMILLFKKDDPVTPSKVLFAAGSGYLGFSFLRLTFFIPYHDNLVWLTLWEEGTELIYVIGVGITLWNFRHRLFQKEKES